MADNKVNSGLLEFSEDQKVFVALDAETSEVKKAVTIDGDGVETDIGGGGGGDVTVEALSVTENGTYSEEGKAYSPVTVDVAGGFKTIEVVCINETDDSINLLSILYPIVNHIAQGDNGYSANNVDESGLMLSESDSTVAANSTKTLKYLLAENYNFAITEQSWDEEIPASVSVSGYAEKSYVTEEGISYGVFIITGNCIITVSDNN